MDDLERRETIRQFLKGIGYGESKYVGDTHVQCIVQSAYPMYSIMGGVPVDESDAVDTIMGHRG